MKKLAEKIFILILILLSSSHVQANPGASQRIKTVLSHIKDHPMQELPVTNHPVYPERVFCRLFNISLSARAYFHLSTDPTLDAASNEDMRKVAQWYLDKPDKVRDPDSAYWAGEYHSAILAQFGSRGSERKGALSRETELLLLKYMFDFVNYWSRLELYDLSLTHHTFHYWGSENHWWQEIVTCWGYLLALKDDPQFAGKTMGDGHSIQEHYARTVDYMKQHMQQRARKGFLTEISSGGYSMRMQNMWHMIFSISPEPALKQLAGNTLDLWWAFWAEEQISGERGGGKVRHRRMRGLLPNSETHMISAWLYFGVGAMNFDYITKSKADTVDLASHYMAMLSGYVPDHVIYKILEDRKNASPYAVTQRRQGKSLLPYREFAPFITVKTTRYNVEAGDCLKYSWVTPNFVLGTVMRPPHHSGVWDPGSAQGWWHGLLIAGKGPHEPPERVVPTLINNAPIQQSDFYGDQYAVQSKGSFMARRLPDEFWEIDNTRLPMGIYISKGLKGQTEHRGSFIYIKSPAAWVAVRAVGTGFVAANQMLQNKHAAGGDFYRLENEDQPLIMETVDAGSDEGFDVFKARVANAVLTSGRGEHSYASLSGDKFTMFDDRSPPMINGKRFDYNPAKAYESPYVQSEWDSGIVTLSAGATKTILNFMQ
jgi:hypothetical protein